MTPTTIYAAALHIAGLAAIVVLVALGKVSWAEGGPIIGALVGLAVGIPVTPTQPATQTLPEPVTVVTRPAMPIAAD
jgi:hypothetical protein